MRDEWYLELAAAFVRGRLPDAPPGDEDAVRFGIATGLKMYKFERKPPLPRVKRVLGVLRGLAPGSLLDVGSGRGTFLWPLLDSFPALEVTAIDLDPIRARDLGAVSRGGVRRLQGALMDARAVALADKSRDVATLLEVLEHVPEAERAAREAVRVARAFVVASVPSKEDDNPEHLRVYDRGALERLFLEAGARRVSVEYVLNHAIAIARC